MSELEQPFIALGNAQTDALAQADHLLTETQSKTTQWHLVANKISRAILPHLAELQTGLSHMSRERERFRIAEHDRLNRQSVILKSMLGITWRDRRALWLRFTILMGRLFYVLIRVITIIIWISLGILVLVLAVGIVVGIFLVLQSIFTEAMRVLGELFRNVFN